jgi:hypothetical protein
MPTAAFAARTSTLVLLSSLRSGLSLHRLLEASEGLAAARLVSTPSRRTLPPGLARDCHVRFPRIWAVLHRRFPGEHSSCLKSAAYAIPPRLRGWSITIPVIEQATGIYTSVSESLGFCGLTGFFFSLGLMMLIAAASSWVFMCDA